MPASPNNANNAPTGAPLFFPGFPYGPIPNELQAIQLPQRPPNPNQTTTSAPLVVNLPDLQLDDAFIYLPVLSGLDPDVADLFKEGVR